MAWHFPTAFERPMALATKGNRGNADWLTVWVVRGSGFRFAVTYICIHVVRMRREWGNGRRMVTRFAASVFSLWHFIIRSFSTLKLINRKIVPVSATLQKFALIEMSRLEWAETMNLSCSLIQPVRTYSTIGCWNDQLNSYC